MRATLDNPTGPATDAQIALLRALIREREITTISVRKGLTEAQASDLIDVAMAAPRIRKPTVAPGLYLFEDDIIKVAQNKAGTGSYAQRLELEGQAHKTGRWRFMPGLISDLTPAHALDLKDAIAFGRSHTVCVCGKRLTGQSGIHIGCKAALKGGAGG